MTPDEISIDALGLRLAARAWGPVDGRPTLALHGWLDNAGTWDGLAPLLAAEGLRVVALDLPGHGRSEHRGDDAWWTSFADWLLVTIGVVDALGWDRFTFLGHSMGAAVSTMCAGVLGDRVEGLLLVEGLTPLTSREDESLAQFKKGLDAQARTGAAAARVHPTLDALKARIAARPWRLSAPAVDALAARGSKEVDGGWAFTHDVRLKGDSLVRFTPVQVESFLRGVTAPALLVVAEDGLPYPGDEVARYRAAMPGLTITRVPGRHHVHLDDPDRVFAALRSALRGL